MFKNNFENLSGLENNDIKKEKQTREIEHEKIERVEASFSAATDNSLVPLIEALQKREANLGSPELSDVAMPENLSDLERQVWEKSIQTGKAPEIRFLIDIDGVLIDTDKGLKDFILAFLKGNLKEAAGIAGGKIASNELRTLLRCRNASTQIGEKEGEHLNQTHEKFSDSENKWKYLREISLVTDRFPRGPKCFPCFNAFEKKLFEKHGVQVHTATLKPLASGGKVYRDEKEDLIYYFGSSRTDQAFSRRIREKIAENGEDPKKLIYVEIQQHDKRNIL